MICKAKSCVKKSHAKNYCPTHLSRLNRGKDIDAPIRKVSKRISSVCTLENCDRPYSCKGLCGFHYKRQRTGVPLDKPYLGYSFNRANKLCPTCSKKFSVQYSLRKTKYCSYSCRAKVRTGSKNPNWKGGITGSDQEQRNRFNRELREFIFARDNYTCVMCQISASGKLQVDHIKKWSEYPELRFDVDNCRTLCMACHYYVTFKRKMPKGMIWGRLPRKT